MTRVYHGCKNKLNIQNKTSSRYGIVVLFFTTEIRLARMYGNTIDNVYQTELKPDKTVDFKGRVSHSSQFRNLIFQLSKEGYDVVAIENIYDRPNDNYPLEKSTIYVVYDISKLQNVVKVSDNTSDRKDIEAISQNLGMPNP